MKTLLLFFIAASFIGAVQAQAGGKGGSEGGGGGDLGCDEKVRFLANNLKGWISNHGAESGPKLDLSSSVVPKSNPLRPYSLAEYDKKMSDMLDKPLDSSCVSLHDAGYPVEVEKHPKICKTSLESGTVHMICQADKFLGLSKNEQVQQIHHEFAILVEGLEPDYGPISTYKISRQLSAFTASIIEQLLVVLSPPNHQTTPARSPEDQFANDAAACVRDIVQSEVSKRVPWASDDHLLITDVSAAQIHGGEIPVLDTVFQMATGLGVGTGNLEYLVRMSSEHAHFEGWIDISLKLTSIRDPRYDLAIFSRPSCVMKGQMRIMNLENNSDLIWIH